MYPRKGQLDIARYNKGLEAKEFFLNFLSADCERIAVENPVHCRVFKMPLYTQEIQPYQFGHPYSKKTRLWLKGLPALEPTEVISNYTPFLPSGTGRKLGGVSYGAKSCPHDSKARSKTFPGIARAMAEQWAGNLKRGEKDD